MSQLTACVVMCTYNGALFVAEQLASIVAQSRRPDRMIISDDASSDETVAILRRFAADAPFPVQITENGWNLGYRKNFERAIALADEDLIVLSDQDDVWNPLKLEKIQAAFQGSPEAGFVFTDADVVDAHLRPVGYRLWHAMRFPEAKQIQLRRGEAFELLLKRNVVTGATMAFRSHYKSLVLPIPESSTHDAWIALLIAAVCNEVVTISEPLIKYRQHAASQIGIQQGSLLDRVGTIRRMGRIKSGELDHLRNALERLRRDERVSPERLGRLRDTIDHVQVRMNLPDRRVERLRPICREVINGRYRRLANGLATAVRDVIV